MKSENNVTRASIEKKNIMFYVRMMFECNGYERLYLDDEHAKYSISLAGVTFEISVSYVGVCRWRVDVENMTRMEYVACFACGEESIVFMLEATLLNMTHNFYA